MHNVSDRPKDNIKVCFILIPGFALTSFALSLESLHVANKLGGRCHYQSYICHVGGADADVIFTNTGVPIAATASLEDCEDADIILVCAYKQAAQFHHRALQKYLDKAFARGALLASLTSGSFIFARYGYLKGLSCTLVNEQVDLFKEMYPAIAVQENLYSVNDKLMSCAGGTSALDMMLYIIAQHSGYDFIEKVSHVFLQEYMRNMEHKQNSILLLGYRMRSACLGAAVELMQNNISTPYSIQEIAQKIGTSTRTLEMTFKKHENVTPSQFYMNLRLEKAYYLVTTSLLPFSQISLACGFASQSHFGKCFKQRYGYPPNTIRNNENG